MSQFDISWLTPDWLIQEEYDLEWIVEEYPIFYFQSTSPEEIVKLAERVRRIQEAKPELWSNKIAESWIKTALLHCNFPAAQTLEDEFNVIKYGCWQQAYWEMINEQEDLDWTPEWLAEVLLQARPHFPLEMFWSLITSQKVLGYKWRALETVDCFDYADVLFLMGESFSTLAYYTGAKRVMVDGEQIENFAQGFVRWAEEQSNAETVRTEFLGIRPLCGEVALRIIRERLNEFWGGPPEYSSDRLPEALRVVFVLAKALAAELSEESWKPAAEELYRRASDLGGDVAKYCDRIVKKYEFLLGEQWTGDSNNRIKKCDA